MNARRCANWWRTLGLLRAPTAGRRGALLVAVVALLLAPVAAPATSGGAAVIPAVASFQGLGLLPGGVQSFALGVSGDGAVTVGYVLNPDGSERGFRWTATSGLQDLGTLGGSSAEAHAANGDGSVIVGISWDATGAQQAFRWTAAGGMKAIQIYDPRDVSADGSVVVGGGVWTLSGGVQPPVGQLGGNAGATADGLSPEGSVITGWSATASGFLHAFRWTAATGMRDLGALQGNESAGHDASTNGGAIVGESRADLGFWHAFSWTATSGMSDLGTLGGTMSAAYSVSNDGSVIVGKSLTTNSSASENAFRWTTKQQIQLLQQELLNAGVTSVQNWILTSATRVSADGTVIVGFGLNPSRQTEAWRAVLPLPV